MPKSLEERRQTLLAMERRFRHLAGEFQEELVENTNAESGVEDSSGGSSDNETADVATTTYNAELAQTMRFRYRDRLVDVQSALQRIRDGSYGICAACGAVIPEARLDTMPETPYCIDHAASELAVDDQPNLYPKPWPKEPWSA